MSRPPNWLLGPRVREKDTAGALKCFPVGVERTKCVRTEIEGEREKKKGFKRFLKRANMIRGKGGKVGEK